MSFDAFMKVDGVEGESLTMGTKVGSSCFPTTTTPCSPSVRQPARMGELLLEGFPSAISRSANMWIEPPRSYLSFAVGVRISKNVTIRIHRAGTEKFKYLDIVLEEVLISLVSGQGADQSGFPHRSSKPELRPH